MFFVPLLTAESLSCSGASQCGVERLRPGVKADPVSDWRAGFGNGASAPVDVGGELQRSGTRLINKPTKISLKHSTLYYIRPLAERRLSVPEQLPVLPLCQTCCSLNTEPLTCTQSSLISLPSAPGISSPPYVASRALNTQRGAECADDLAG